MEYEPESDIFMPKSFADVDLTDSLFDGLKEDYGGFADWFKRKSLDGSKAFVNEDNEGRLRAFVYLKEENEEILLNGQSLPRENRLKIGTMKVSKEVQGNRLGEGAIGLALWKWQQLKDVNQIYVTVFPKHQGLIEMLMSFGFEDVGIKSNGEGVYLKDKRNLGYDTPKTSFPFINPATEYFGYLPIEQAYHDVLFPFSKLANTTYETTDYVAAANGITKVFIATPSKEMAHRNGTVVFMYRIFDGEYRLHRSVLTSYCTIINRVDIRRKGRYLKTFDEFRNLVKNKSVYSDSQLEDSYTQKGNIVVYELIYNGFFGAGNNINLKTLRDNGLWEGHPYQKRLSRDDFESIIRMGGKDVRDIIVD